MTSHVGRPLNSIRPPLTSRICSQNLARHVTSTGATATSFANAERSVSYVLQLQYSVLLNISSKSKSSKNPQINLILKTFASCLFSGGSVGPVSDSAEASLLRRQSEILAVVFRQPLVRCDPHCHRCIPTHGMIISFFVV